MSSWMGFCDEHLEEALINIYTKYDKDSVMCLDITDEQTAIQCDFPKCSTKSTHEVYFGFEEIKGSPDLSKYVPLRS